MYTLIIALFFNQQVMISHVPNFSSERACWEASYHARYALTSKPGFELNVQCVKQ
jgi:hypothetical protein